MRWELSCFIGAVVLAAACAAGNTGRYDDLIGNAGGASAANSAQASSSKASATTAATASASASQSSSDASSTVDASASSTVDVAASSTQAVASTAAIAAVSSTASGGSCAHSPCDQGGPLNPACDPCVLLICLQVDPSCCSNVWDDFCATFGSVLCNC